MTDTWDVQQNPSQAGVIKKWEGYDYGFVKHWVPTQHDSTDETDNFKAIHCGIGGTVTAVIGGDAVQYTVAGGSYLFGNFQRINDTGTSLTNAQMVVGY